MTSPKGPFGGAGEAVWTAPADVLHFVPGESGLQLSVGQRNDPEAQLGVILQNLREVPRYCNGRKKRCENGFTDDDRRNANGQEI